MAKPSLVSKVRSSGMVGLTTLTMLLANAGVVKAQIDSGIQAANPNQPVSDLPTIIKNAINILLYIVGVAAVIMLIVGGIRYVVSAGDQQQVTNAKNTILYAIIGVVVALLAYVAVQFVFNQLTQ